MMDTPDLQHDRGRRRLVVTIFLALSLSSGLLFSFLTPPYQAPDEAAHFFRAYSLSEGQFFLVEQDGKRGDVLPASLIASRRAFGPLLGNPEQKVTRAWLDEQLERPTHPRDRTFTDLGPTAVYSPVTHLPQAAGIAIARVFDAPLLGTLYAARIGNVIIASTLIAFAIWLLPFGRWAVSLIALLPMAIFLRGSSSGDSITTALAFLLIAAIFHLTWGPDRPHGGLIVVLLVTIVLLALTKPVYCSMVLLIPMIGMRRFASSGKAILFYLSVCGALVLGATLFQLWLSSSAPSSSVTVPSGLTPPVPSPGSIDPEAQLDLAARQPLTLIRAIFTDLARHSPRYLAHFIGRLGWLDTPLPVPLLAAYCLTLLFVLITGGASNLQIAARARLLALMILLATVLAISLAMYVVWTPVGAATVEGVQGRYFHPIAPLALLLFANQRFALRGRVAAWFPIGFLAFNAIGLAVTAAVIVARYYQ